jgi:hypothetical protein
MAGVEMIDLDCEERHPCSLSQKGHDSPSALVQVTPDVHEDKGSRLKAP